AAALAARARRLGRRRHGRNAAAARRRLGDTRRSRPAHRRLERRRRRRVLRRGRRVGWPGRVAGEELGGPRRARRPRRAQRAQPRRPRRSAQQVRAVDTLAGSGGDLASTAADALGVADPRTIRPVGGRIDLDAVRKVQGPLDQVRRVLARSQGELARVDSPWLVTPVADRYVDLKERVGRALHQADVAARAAELAPDLLGENGVRNYLLAVYTPAESRPGGGFMGNYGILTADHGKVALSRFGREKELDEGGLPAGQRKIDGVPQYLANWGSFHPEHYWGVINVTNDFPTV